MEKKSKSELAVVVLLMGGGFMFLAVGHYLLCILCLSILTAINPAFRK